MICTFLLILLCVKKKVFILSLVIEFAETGLESLTKTDAKLGYPTPPTRTERKPKMLML